MFLIWSFHIQYEQPASFYLKAPTVMYVFIYISISIQAIRFEHRYIMWSGLAVIFGWASMVGYVLVADPNDTMITQNYVDYLKSNAVIICTKIIKNVVDDCYYGRIMCRCYSSSTHFKPHHFR